MNDRSDIERVLRHWLDDGPSTMSDRVIDGLERRISRQPQRRVWRLLNWRFEMTRPVNFAAVGLMLAVALVAVWSLWPRSDGIGGPTPSPAPTASPSSTPLASPRPSTAATPAPVSVSCEDGLIGCAGPLAAGSHGSSYFGPRLVHYVTPTGWTNSIDRPTIYKLDAPDGKTSILLWAGVSIGDQTPTSCEPVALAGGVSPSAAEWVSYLTSHPGLVTTTPAAVDFPGSIDQNGQSLDISIDPDWTQTCPGGTGPEVKFIAHTAQPPAAYGVRPADRLHLIVVDTTYYGSATVLIEVYGPSDDAGFSAAVDIASGVMETFVFGCGPGAGYGPCGGYPFSSPPNAP